MYAPEQLGQPSDSQRQTLLLNLWELKEAEVYRLSLSSEEELAIYEEPNENSMILSFFYKQINEFGQHGSVYDEITITNDGELSRYIDYELSENFSSMKIPISDEVECYHEAMELLEDDDCSIVAQTVLSYDPAMNELANSVMAVSSVELAKYVRLTDYLIERHVRSRRNWPAIK